MITNQHKLKSGTARQKRHERDETCLRPTAPELATRRKGDGRPTKVGLEDRLHRQGKVLNRRSYDIRSKRLQQKAVRRIYSNPRNLRPTYLKIVAGRRLRSKKRRRDKAISQSGDGVVCCEDEAFVANGGDDERGAVANHGGNRRKDVEDQSK
ncbi:hypothetical protein L596_014513 [Steinernema carpocapsae]|uniref:Uncharacterized protein n=1 Tax=Steinernema carpocapsae TaxID=34508 RepID=A0A4U5NC57_STECR|nr:hypothetical protein L596_014513 [Steinernema carpocapsae]